MKAAPTTANPDVGPPLQPETLPVEVYDSVRLAEFEAEEADLAAVLALNY